MPGDTAELRPNRLGRIKRSTEQVRGYFKRKLRTWPSLREPLLAVFDIATFLKWSLLKVIAVVLTGLFGSHHSNQGRIISIGNALFSTPTTADMLQDYETYDRICPVQLGWYLDLLPASEWLTHRFILDLGAGLGGYSATFASHGAAGVVALEIHEAKVAYCSRVRGSLVSVVRASADHIPFSAKTFDTVFSHTVFEHLRNIEAALSEAQRVLKDNGHIIIAYNFFHHRRGDHLFPYINFPWPTWVVPEGILCSYWSDMLAVDQARGRMSFYRKGERIENLTQDTEIYLNKLTLDEFEDIVRSTDLRIELRLTSEAIGRVFPLLLKVPKLKYFLSGTVFYVLQKTGCHTDSP